MGLDCHLQSNPNQMFVWSYHSQSEGKDTIVILRYCFPEIWSISFEGVLQIGQALVPEVLPLDICKLPRGGYL